MIPVHKAANRQHGMTLVELLVAIAIGGVLIMAIVSLSGGMLTYTRRANQINQNLTDLNDAIGYISLKLRGAKQLVGNNDSIEITDGSQTFQCSIGSPDGSCVALVVPVVDRASPTAEIVGYELLAFRVATLDAWSGDPGMSPGWDGQDTPLMLEYRSPLACGSPCSAPPLAPSSIVADRVSLVISDLYFFDASGSPFEPFEVEGSNTATIRLRMLAAGQTTDRAVPSEHPSTVVVTRRL